MSVLVADELRYLNRPPVGCPAAVLVDGELRRLGVPTRRGVLALDADGQVDDAMALAAVLTNDRGIGVAAALDDLGGRLAARTALTAWLAVARRPRTVLLAAPPTHRQDALAAIAEESDVVFVVGSSDSARLVELARQRGTPAHLIDDAGDIRPGWLASAGVVGLTAGASAPQALVDGVIEALGGLGPVSVDERETARDTVHFGLPGTVRR